MMISKEDIQLVLRQKREVAFLEEAFETANESQMEYIGYNIEEIVDKDVAYIISGDSQEYYNALLKAVDEEINKNGLNIYESDFSNHLVMLAKHDMKGKTIEEIRNILSLRTYSILCRNGVKTVDELAQIPLSEISKWRNVGQYTFSEIEDLFLFIK